VPSMGRPTMGEPSTADPKWVSPSTGQPSTGRPDMGQPIYGHAASCALMLEDGGLAPRDTRHRALDSMHYRACAGPALASRHTMKSPIIKLS
jgi:hypothetical protein